MFPHLKSALNPKAPSKKHLLSSKSFLTLCYSLMHRDRFGIANLYSNWTATMFWTAISLMSPRVLSTAERLTRTYLISCRSMLVYNIIVQFMISKYNLYFSQIFSCLFFNFWCLLDIASKKSPEFGRNDARVRILNFWKNFNDIKSVKTNLK